MAGACTFQHPDGRPCAARPLRTGSLCFWHAPEKSAEAARARELGGLRRRKEKTVSTVYDLTGLRTVEDIQRVLTIATLDTLGLDNSVARNRVLLAGATAAARLLDLERYGPLVAELEEEG